MTLPTRLRSTHIGLLWTLAFLVFVLAGFSTNAIGQTDLRDVRRRLGPAALTLKGDRTYNFGGQVVRCQPNQDVGIMAESITSLTITDVIVDGCTVGIIATGPSVRVERVTVRDTTGVCMLLAGGYSTAFENRATGCAYGIVILGNDNTLTNNQSNDNAQDGIIVTGDGNLLEGNEALRNRGVGIHVVRMVPMAGEGRFLTLIQDLATGNVIQGNRALDNGVDLEEFGDCQLGLPNEWRGNTFKTGRPDCVK